MTLIRYERPFGLLRELFGESAFVPAMKTDIKETETAYIVEAELPGVKKENVELICEKGVLTITVKTAEEVTEQKEQYVRRERITAGFGRSFEIEGIDESGISAKIEEGVLLVTLPKKASEEEKHIAIE